MKGARKDVRVATNCVAVFVALFLKAHYRVATAEDLSWILTPTATVVGWLRREPLLFETSMGWVPPDHSFIIAPVCAGVNFMILILTASVLGFSGRFNTPKQHCTWLAAMLGCTYLVTIAVNSLRIMTAVTLYGAEIHAGWFTPERVHRLAGTVIYLSALSATWLALDRLSGRLLLAEIRETQDVEGRAPRDRRASYLDDRAASQSSALHNDGGFQMLMPFLAYLGMTVVLPLMNGAWRQFGAQYVEHALTVCLLTLGAVLLLSIRRSATSFFIRR